MGFLIEKGLNRIIIIAENDYLNNFSDSSFAKVPSRFEFMESNANGKLRDIPIE